MEFNPNNPIVKLCLQGMMMEEKNNPQETSKLFLQAWNEARDDFEKFLAAYYLARHQKETSDTLKWYQTALQFAIASKEDFVKSAFPALYSNIATCYEKMGDEAKATKNKQLAESFNDKIYDTGPFFHGTKADLEVGDFLTVGGNSNYKDGLTMNHIYFTAMPNGAGLAAALAKGDGPEHVYIVEPTGKFENDPNVTDKKFPGNLTRSYRTEMPLRIVGELNDWTKQTPEDIQRWRDKLANNKGEIIN